MTESIPARDCPAEATWQLLRCRSYSVNYPDHVRHVTCGQIPSAEQGARSMTALMSSIAEFTLMVSETMAGACLRNEAKGYCVAMPSVTEAVSYRKG